MAAMDDEDLAPGGKNIAEFATYEDFLSSQVTQRDMNYLEDINLARKIVEFGYRGSREGFSLDRFMAVKAELEQRKSIYNVRTILSAGRTFDEPMLRALQMREESNRTRKNASIIFIRDINECGQEVSSYLDYSHRLATEDFRPIFDGKKKLMPKTTDLSFFNWETQNVSSKSSPNYEMFYDGGLLGRRSMDCGQAKVFKVIAKSPNGMLFRNKRDGKIINPDPFIGSPGDNSSRTVVPTEKYISVIVFDHYNRRKT